MNLLSIDQIAERIESFEASHEVAARVLNMLDRGDVGARDVAIVVSSDPVMVSRVMRMANSVMFGNGGRIRELHAAVAVLGFDAVRSIALTSMVEGVGVVTPQNWEHSVTSAVGAGEVARLVGADRQLAFSMGLLHDIGEAMIASLDRTFLTVLQDRRATPPMADAEAEMLQMERRAYGMHHATLGAEILSAWNFSPELAAAVGKHHTTKGSITRVHACVVDGDRISSLISSKLPAQEFATLPGLLLPQYVPVADLERVLMDVRQKAQAIIYDLFV